MLWESTIKLENNSYFTDASCTPSVVWYNGDYLEKSKCHYQNI